MSSRCLKRERTFAIFRVMSCCRRAKQSKKLERPRNEQVDAGQEEICAVRKPSVSRGAITGEEPYRFVIHDRDSIYSRELDSSLRSLGLRGLRTPYRSPQANAFCERLIATARRECLDFVIPLHESHIRMILKPCVAHFNRGRPHSSLGPGIPEPSFPKVPLLNKRHHIPDHHRVSAIPVLGRLHHDYKLEKIAA